MVAVGVAAIIAGLGGAAIFPATTAAPTASRRWPRDARQSKVGRRDQSPTPRALPGSAVTSGTATGVGISVSPVVDVVVSPSVISGPSTTVWVPSGAAAKDGAQRAHRDDGARTHSPTIPASTASISLLSLLLILWCDRRYGCRLCSNRRNSRRCLRRLRGHGLRDGLARRDLRRLMGPGGAGSGWAALTLVDLTANAPIASNALAPIVAEPNFICFEFTVDLSRSVLW